MRFFKLTISGMMLVTLLGCGTAQFAAMGETSTGKPVSAVLMTSSDAGTAIITVDLETYNHGNCKGQTRKPVVTAIRSNVDLECDSGKSGSAKILHDYVNFRDVIDYKVSGERGRVIAGKTNVVQ